MAKTLVLHFHLWLCSSLKDSLFHKDMECNKEEATRAMEIAKKKVTETDYNAAKIFANKAQNLYPQLSGLKQVLMLINVYISAGNKISGGESDWYGILGVDPLADDEVLKKQYRKLALLLHPDKNKCEGAEGAFKLVLEAWCLLSDKVKRIAYDQKRISKEVKPKRSRKKKQPPNQPKTPQNQPKKPPNQPKKPPNPPKQPPNQQKQPPNEPKEPPNAQNQPPNQPKQPPNPPKQPQNQPKQPPNQPKQPSYEPQQSPNEQNQPSSQSSSNGVRNGKARSNKRTLKVSTFWTMCNKCKTEYEYIKVYYLNKTVLCRNCRGNFVAAEKEKTTQAETEKTPQAPNQNTNVGVSSCGRDSNSGNVENPAEERVYKKLRTDDYAEASSGIKV